MKGSVKVSLIVLMITLNFAAVSAQEDYGRFKVAGVNSDKEVKEFYLKFQKAVAGNDKDTVASTMTYPLRVNFPNDKSNKGYTFINNKKSFLKAYDKIFDRQLKKFISQIDVENIESLWARYDGISVGRGVIWIGVHCNKRHCEDGKYHINIRTIHGNSNLMDLD
jgi:hypothetical protein